MGHGLPKQSLSLKSEWLNLSLTSKRWQETTMFEMREIKCKECRSIIGYSDADYAPLILCKDCANKENSEHIKNEGLIP